MPAPGYPALVARLSAARRAGVRLGLDRARATLARLGHLPAPRARLGRAERSIATSVQIGGTNGKGSTAAFTDAILRAAGLSVGLYTSPHLSRWSERFRVGAAELPPDELAALGEEVA